MQSDVFFSQKLIIWYVDVNVLVWSLQQGDRGNRKRYLPSDKERPGSPLSKRMAMSPDRGRTDGHTLLTHIHGL